MNELVRVSAKCLVTVLCTVLLDGCGLFDVKQAESSIAVDEFKSVFTDFQGDSDQQESSSPLPAMIGQELLPSMTAKLPAHVSMDMSPRFDIKVDNVNIKTVLMGLVKNTQFNIVPHPSLEGKISLDLKNVSIDEVLRTLANVYGYDYSHSKMGYEVFVPKLRSRIFQLNYLNVNRQGKSQIRVSSGQVSEVSSKKSEGGTAQSSEVTASSSVSGTEVNTTSSNKFWQDLTLSLSAIVGTDLGRSVVVNPHSGVVVVKAMPTELRKVEDYLVITQAIISRQVILEAKILEVELSEGFQSGINWAAFAGSGNKTATIGQVGGGTLFGSGISEIAGNTGTLDPIALSQVQGTNTSAFGGMFSLALNLDNFSAFIEALETQGDVHVLSSPRVSTVNNQKAVIKVGSDEFFITGIETETSDTNNSTNQSVNVELTPFFSGVALDVTPQIDEYGAVTLHVHPSVSDVKEKIKQVTVNSTDGTLSIPLAFSSIRESDSIIRANSGQVVVIGGLMQNLVSDSNAGVPLLSSIPFLGALFTHEKKQRRKSELVILLRPIVVTNDQQWNDMVESYATGSALSRRQ